jgi:type II secretory pathway component GspD/PulD (secretin)
MLGGFIKNQKSTSKSGVPFLMDIPLLGNLFSSRSDSKQREELIVMMRPTVLKTPELAAEETIKEKQRLPGVSAALAEEAGTEHKLIEAEKKAELERAEAEQKQAGSGPWRWKRVGSVDTNTVAPPNP